MGIPSRKENKCPICGNDDDYLDTRAHFFGPTWRERIEHLQKWEERMRVEEMWKKKYDWRCPDCGGQMMNRGGSTFKDDKKSLLMECLVCHHRFVGGDYTMDPVNENDPSYISYLKESSELHDYLGFYSANVSFVKKELIPQPGYEDEGRVITSEPIHGETHFEISWCVLEELELHTGSILHSDPAYNAIVRRTFDAIELNKPYTITVHIQPPKKETLWQKIWPWAYHEPYMAPYISAIKGLVLEENKVGFDRRVNPRSHIANV
jgi:predicted RNA-binding Zn-ribbon protein involved in translation (DUF1610 family)